MTEHQRGGHNSHPLVRTEKDHEQPFLHKRGKFRGTTQPLSSLIDCAIRQYIASGQSMSTSEIRIEPKVTRLRGTKV